MSKGTAPAWHARDIAREKVLDEIKRAIQDKEDKFENRLDLYRLVLRLVDTQLSSGTLSMGFMSTLPGIPWKTRKAVFDVLLSADEAIVLFERAPEEGNALWAKISKWAMAKIADSHIVALEALEKSNPQLIFGAATAMTEVPME